MNNTTTERTRDVTLNEEQKLYVIPCGDGYTCWGFQNCWDEVKAMVKLLGGIPEIPLSYLSEQQLEAEKATWFGSIALYHCSRKLRAAYAQSKHAEKTWFDPRTPSAVERVLEHCRKHRTPVRIWLGDQKTGLSWLEEHDTIGTVGRSMGPMKVPLLIPGGADGGAAILTACIVRIDNTNMEETMWEHKKFHLPPMQIEYRHESKDAAVKVNGEHFSRHDNVGEAAAFVAWLHGTPPYKPDND